jgi:GT2 family glycosyltransferase
LNALSKAISESPSTEIQVVLVDNGSTDNTLSVMREWSQSATCQVTIVTEPKAGLSNARNTGVKAATGDILAFTDDDCELNPDYFNVLLNCYSTDSRPVIRGGQVLLGDPTDMNYSILVGKEKRTYNDLQCPGGFIIGANMAIPRSVFTMIGEFDPRFGAGAIFKAGEETDFFYRAYRKGIEVVYEPLMVVHHFHGRKTKEEIIQLSNSYFIGGGAMFAKHIFDRRLLRHLYWDAKKCIASLFRNSLLVDSHLKITYGTLMKGYAKGMLLYCRERTRSKRSGDEK